MVHDCLIKTQFVDSFDVGYFEIIISSFGDVLDFLRYICIERSLELALGLFYREMNEDIRGELHTQNK